MSSSSITEFITEFAEFLNQNGFSISSEKISRFISVCGEQDSDITDEKEILSVMSTVFCTSKKEVVTLPPLFKLFLRHKDSIIDAQKTDKEIKTLSNQKSAADESIKKINNDREQRINEIQRKKHEEEQRFREELLKRDASETTVPLSAADIKKIEKSKNTIIEFNNEVLTKGLLEGQINEFSPAEISAVEKELVEAAKEAFLKKDLVALATYKDLQSILNKAGKAIRKSMDDDVAAKRREVEVRRHLQPYVDEITQVYREYNEQLESARTQQRKINEQLSQ